MKMSMHIISGCNKLAQKEYKMRHDNSRKTIHWDLTRIKGFRMQTSGVNPKNVSKADV